MTSPLDLGALAREREARQRSKRKERSISPPASRKAPKLETTISTLPSGAILKSFTSTVEGDQTGRKTAIANLANEKLKASPIISQVASSTTLPKSGSITYPNGVVKKTWAYGHARDGEDVKIEEVLEPQTLQIAVLSAYQWDTQWIFSKLKIPPNGGSTKCIFVMQGKDATLRDEIREQVSTMKSWLRICFPPMEGQTHCMHSKLMLLFHADKLRIAVPTANLLNFDWGETGVMENSVFMVDLPRRAAGQQHTSQDMSEFGKELMFFLDKQGLDQDIKEGMLKFDFSATKHIAFVHSIGGVCKGADAQHSGLASLSRAVQQLGVESEDVQIDFAASSIGSLKDAQLHLLHAAACGEDVFKWSLTNTNKQQAAFFDKSSTKINSIRSKINIYFPTKETVQSTPAGSVGTICLSREWFEGSEFPRRCFKDYISTRPGLLSHNKIMYVRSTPEQKKQTAFVYVGSSNMSESAWGKLVFNKRDKTWHVNCRNWECGVLLRVGDQTTMDISSLSIFDGVVRVPFLYPASEYGGRDPWYFKETH